VAPTFEPVAPAFEPISPTFEPVAPAFTPPAPVEPVAAPTEPSSDSNGFDLFDWAASDDDDVSDTTPVESAGTPYEDTDASAASAAPFVWGLTPGVGSDPLVEQPPAPPAQAEPIPGDLPAAGPVPVPAEFPVSAEPPTVAFAAAPTEPFAEHVGEQTVPPVTPAPVEPVAPLVEPVAPLVEPVAPPVEPVAPPIEAPEIGLAALLGQSTETTWTGGFDELSGDVVDEPTPETAPLEDTVAFDARAAAVETPTELMASIVAPQPDLPVTELLPTATPQAQGPVETPTELLAAPAEPLAELFGSAAWAAAETEVVPASLAPQPTEPATDDGSVPPTRQGPNVRILVMLAVGLLALIVLIGLFAFGTRLPALTAAPVATPSPTPSATPTPTPTPTVTPKPAAALPAGVHPWSALGGGECLQPYTNPWAETFTVVDCAAPHAAQLVYTNLLSADIAAPYPGADALASQINLLCTKPGIIDLGAAGQYPDLQLQGSYPATAKQWTDGQRSYYCFASRSSGQPLTASVAGPGPTG
jgi:hypothetical protein